VKRERGEEMEKNNWRKVKKQREEKRINEKKKRNIRKKNKN